MEHGEFPGGGGNDLLLAQYGGGGGGGGYASNTYAPGALTPGQSATVNVIPVFQEQ